LIKHDLNEGNVINIYSMCLVLGVEKLIKDLEGFIINEVLNVDNCALVYLEAIRVIFPLISLVQ
jgi:hypothetical protein